MRRTSQRVAAAVMAAFVLASASACAPGDDDATPAGPNGYTLSATIESTRVWWDRSEASGLTDLILQDETGQYSLSCLGTASLACYGGPQEARQVLVIAPSNASRAVVQWYGTEIELQRGEGPSAEHDQVFAGVLGPHADESAGQSLQVLDEAGAVVWER